MATNQLLPFANGAGANVETFANWSALAQVATGFGSGLAVSKHFNYILAQGGAAGYAIGKVVVDWLGRDATIDATTLGANFEAALKAKIGGPYLPLAGGTMTGTIKISNPDYSGIGIANATSNSWTEIDGGKAYRDGAQLALYGKDSSVNPSKFILRADDGTTQNNLTGSTDGTLKWRAQEIERVVAKSSGYIKYASGLIVQWGTRASIATDKTLTITFPTAFTTTAYAFSDCAARTSLSVESRSQSCASIMSGTKTTTGLKIGQDTYADNGGTWIAIGF